MCLILAEARREVCVCVCVDDMGVMTQMSILHDSCSLPSDASHLRHRHWHPSKPSACLSLLIDLSLDGGVWEFFGENMYFDRFCAQKCVPYAIKGAGPQLEDAFIASGWISRLCDALSCLNKAAGSLMGRHRSSFTPAIWFVFVRLQNALKSAVLDGTSRFLSVWSFTKPALFTLFKDSCQNLRKNKENYSKRKWPWLFSTALETATIIRSQMPEALEWICCVFWHHSMISFPPARRWRQ